MSLARTIKLTIKEALMTSNRVYRVDPVDREDVWKKSDYAILKDPKTNQMTGSAPLPPNHNVQAGDKQQGQLVDRVENLSFATPNKPNAFYGALGRNAGPNGSPVQGAAVYDENKMWGKNADPSYRGELHTTQKDYDNIPKEIKVSQADGDGWKTEDYSGKEEVTTNKEIKNTSSDIVNTRDLLNKQYKVIIHPNVQSIKKHLDGVAKSNPELSILRQL
jgi:hypothetical protein